MAHLPVAGLGRIEVPNVVPRLGATPGSASNRRPDARRTHRRDPNRQLLGFDARQIDDLRARKVI